HDDEVASVAFSPDGHQLASCGGGGLFEAGVVELWDGRPSQDLLIFEGADLEVHSVAFSAGGQRVLARTVADQRFAWDVHSGRSLPEAPKEEPKWDQSAFSPDRQRLAVLDLGVIRIHDLKRTREDEERFPAIARLDPLWQQVQ